MARDFARDFYRSGAWKNCAAAYKKYRGGLCEECLKKGLYTPGIIVHHVIHLDPVNISDPKIALSFDNLKLVCMDCHAKQHRRKALRYSFGPNGEILPP